MPAAKSLLLLSLLRVLCVVVRGAIAGDGYWLLACGTPKQTLRHYEYNRISSSDTADGVNTPRSVNSSEMYFGGV